MVAASLGLLAALAIVTVGFYTSRSFVAMANYVNMDQRSQLALDKMSKEIRQARRLTAFSPTSLTMLDVTNSPVQFVYDSDSRKLFRVAGGVTNAYLTDCDSLNFEMFQHTVKSNTFQCYQPAYLTDAKVIQVTWVCSHKILGAKANTESVQSAQIALRND